MMTFRQLEAIAALNDFDVHTDPDNQNFTLYAPEGMVFKAGEHTRRFPMKSKDILHAERVIRTYSSIRECENDDCEYCADPWAE